MIIIPDTPYEFVSLSIHQGEYRMMLWHRKVYGLGFAKTVERATELAIANLELKLRGRYPLDLKELGL